MCADPSEDRINRRLQSLSDALKRRRLRVRDAPFFYAVQGLLPNARSVGQVRLTEADRAVFPQISDNRADVEAHAPESIPVGLNVKDVSRKRIAARLNAADDRRVNQNDAGQKIRKRREELGLSREQLADRMRDLGQPIRGQQVYRWEERGAEMGGKKVPVLERALDMYPGWLHGEAPAGDGVLTHSGLLVALDELQPPATVAERERLTKHLSSLEAQNDVVTASYVKGYINGVRDGGAPSDAHALAVNEEARERMQVEGRRRVAPAKKKHP